MSGGLSTSLTDREGVALVARIITRDMRWIFREQPIVDQGIDGLVEEAVEGLGTGRLIAVQIKSSASHFRPVKNGWAFYYSERERDLWLGHVLPVMVVLVDVETETAHWQRISLTTERRTIKRYAVTVPADQILSTAREAWALAASGTEQRAVDRYSANLEVLPPPVRRLIVKEGAGGVLGKLLALHLAEGRINPAGTAQALITSRPHWMQTDDFWPWRALASYCANHGTMRESADALEIAAEAGGDGCGRRLASAALHISGLDRTRAAGLVKSAREHGGADLIVAIVEAILELNEGDASPPRIDGVLAAGGSGLSTDATAQAFLAERALRARDLASAARHAERAFALEPDGTEEMARLARIYVRRSVTADAQVDDMARAVELLGAAVAQRRQWSGPTIGLLVDLARALMMRGEHGTSLRWLLPPPRGTASATEAADPKLLRFALTAAHLNGSAETVRSVEAQMEGTIEDRVALARLGLLQLNNSEECVLWTEELARAQSAADWEAIAHAVYRLATLNVDVTDQLEPLIRDGILPPRSERLPQALVVLHRSPDDGLALLRALAAEEIIAAEHLIETLTALGRLEDAAEACAAAFERYRSSRFQTQRALLLFRCNPDDQAEHELREALQTEEGPSERLMLATRLAHIASAVGESSKAETILSTAMGYVDPPPDSAVWNLVEVQLSEGAGVRAAATISRRRPQCRSANDARLWGRAMVNVPWDDVIASEAIALASRFSSDPKLATSLLTHLVTATRGTAPADAIDAEDILEGDGEDLAGYGDDRPPVLGELHRRAFEVLDRLIEQHGAATGAQMIKSASPDDLLEKVSKLARLAAPPDVTDLHDLIALGRLPAGIVALVAGKSYASALVHRAAGQLVAVAAADDEHQSEVDVAVEARGGQVVVDLSALMVLSRLSDADTIAGQVSTLLQPRSARNDMLRAAVEVQSRGARSGTLGWDARSERPVFYEQTAEEYRLVRERTDGLETAVRRTSTREATPSPLFENTQDSVRESAWVAAIELAAQLRLPLWCDDLAVRRLARSVGVKAFSTMAMVDVIRDARLQSANGPSEIEEVIQFASRVTGELLAEYVVDVPVTIEQLVAQARADEWVPAASAVAIARPAWWAWQVDPIHQLMQLYSAVRESDPKRLAGWQYAAMLGAGRSRSAPAEASQLLANLALLGMENDLMREPPFEDLVEGCRNARRVADTLNAVGDPMLALPAARKVLSELGVTRSEETVHALIAELGSPVADD